IRLPEGVPDDPPGAETVHGVSNRKSECLGALLERDSVRAFEGARHYLEVARDAGLSCAVVSARSHTTDCGIRPHPTESWPRAASCRSTRSEQLPLRRTRRASQPPAPPTSVTSSPSTRTASQTGCRNSGERARTLRSP